MDTMDDIDHMAYRPSSSPEPEQPVVSEQPSELPSSVQDNSNKLAAIAPLAVSNSNLEPSDGGLVTDDNPGLTVNSLESEYDCHLAQSRHDPSAWNKLIDLAEESGDLAKVKDAYESLLQVYPNTAEVQIAYLEHHLHHPGLFPTAEALFNRFLRPSPSVELWKFYLAYVRRIKTDPSARETIIESYDFALLHIGQDKDSGDIWREYIDFVNAGETHTALEEQQKIDAVRRIYQRAVQIPLEVLEQLWREYVAFEIALNKNTARKFLKDRSTGYMTAKIVLKELRSHLATLFPPRANIPSSGKRSFNLPVPISPHNDSHRMLAKLWRSYLQWEEKNPLDIEDKALLNIRMIGVYRKAVVRMRFNPELWYMAYYYTKENIKTEDALAFLKSGLGANPTSFIINFAYAEAQETAKKHAEVHDIFNNFIQTLRVQLDEVASIDTLNGSAITTSSSSSPQTELAKRRIELGIVWIAYMRFAQRAEGLQQSRLVFGKARKDKWAGWEIFDAAAALEYHSAKAADVATRIYEKGLMKFGGEAEYVLRYLRFLIQINDINNARALFERVITTFPPEKARLLWETRVNYEYHYGDLDAAVKLEKRMSEVYPADSSMRRFAQRHMCANHDPIAERDLGWVRPTPGSTSNSSIRQDLTFSTSASTSSNLARRKSTPPRKRPAPESSQPERTSTFRGTDSGPPSKRPREYSPPPPPPRDGERDPDTDQRSLPRKRYDSPDWAGSSPSRKAPDDRDMDKDPEDTPSPVVFFLSQLPPLTSFDGPVFKVDDLMQVFRKCKIPSGGH